MPDIFKIILIIILFIIGFCIAYTLGRTSPGKFKGSIIISDSDDEQFEGKVKFIFTDEIEEIINYKYVTMNVINQMSRKYNAENGGPKK